MQLHSQFFPLLVGGLLGAALTGCASPELPALDASHPASPQAAAGFTMPASDTLAVPAVSTLPVPTMQMDHSSHNRGSSGGAMSGMDHSAHGGGKKESEMSGADHSAHGGH